MRVITGSQQISCCTVVTLLQVKSESLAHGGKAVLLLYNERGCACFRFIFSEVNSNLGWKWLNSVLHNIRVFLFAVCTVLFYIQFSFWKDLCQDYLLCVYYNTRCGVFSFIPSPVSTPVSTHFPLLLMCLWLLFVLGYLLQRSRMCSICYVPLYLLVSSVFRVPGL